MIPLITIFSSNIPIECHILQCRLNADGLDSFIFDENMVGVDPFSAVAIKGVKLKVPEDQLEFAFESLANNEEQYHEYFDSEIKKQNEILRLRVSLRRLPNLLKEPLRINSSILNEEEISTLITEEEDYQRLSKKKFVLDWKEFFYQLFDFDQDFFQYLRQRPSKYYIEKELVEYHQKELSESEYHCPYCSSEDVTFGFAKDYKWDWVLIVLSVLFYAPFIPYRRNCYCFDCKKSFRPSTARKQNK